ncbi:UDP-N-acetylmuramoyl-L-alanine--D-glutamate ligase [Utexia brackfieldae]|uniref:UDP-N-acetylmuramoyl-L-alanine--D-glutamate ligase n=1 Tax=Utexia brackfieldae TaxID=3074108 RepID=UPI00370D8936
MNYQDKNVVIVGLGITGLSCVNYFLSKGVVPRVIDTRSQPPELDNLDKRIQYHVGSLLKEWLLAADLIVVSPGIALSTPELKAAAEKGIEIIGDIELFCREVNQSPDKKVVAITGANGKTTVTTLVGEILTAAGVKVGIGGNIGLPALSLLEQDNDFYVLELSSFQLETTYSLQANIATILNITEDHMDRYPGGMPEYIQAKQRIYHHAQVCIVNCDDALTLPNGRYSDRCIEFGASQGDYTLDKNRENFLIQGVPVLNTSLMKLVGLHNYTNALVALAIADKLAITRNVSLSVIRAFNGLPHRFELVHEFKGVRWINDSKATNVGSTETALNSLVCKGHLYLLLGGDGKAADFSRLIPYLQGNNISVFAFGRDRQLLTSLRPSISTQTTTMEQAMRQIAEKVQANDVVLLSPACASLDQFKNYMDRGNQFRVLAQELGV